MKIRSGIVLEVDGFRASVALEKTMREVLCTCCSLAVLCTALSIGGA